jgi:hypothetical protein
MVTNDIKLSLLAKEENIRLLVILVGGNVVSGDLDG